MLQKHQRHLKKECPVSIARILAARLVVCLLVSATPTIFATGKILLQYKRPVGAWSGKTHNHLLIRSVMNIYGCFLNIVLKVMLEGRVPDRGGRPNETRPPPEMPSFKQRTEAPQQQRSGWSCELSITSCDAAVQVEVGVVKFKEVSHNLFLYSYKSVHVVYRMGRKW